MKQYIRNHFINLEAYSSARNEYSGSASIFLDANESPFGALNRYPDPLQSELKLQLAKVLSCEANQLFIGNGSDEILDLLIRLFCEPKQDEVLLFPPTYGMYKVLANIHQIAVKSVSLTESFQLDKAAILKVLNAQNSIKLCFVCSPNNPTGNTIQNINWLCEQFSGIVVVDEAYIDFCENESVLSLLQQYENLIITRTFSKVFSLANARVGYAIANKEFIQWLTKIKPPYNVSGLNQQAAIQQINQLKLVKQQQNNILAQRSFVAQQLQAISYVETVYASKANFLLIKVDDAQKRYNELKMNHIIIRNRHSLLKNCLRITIGNAEENEQLIKVMKSLEE